MALVYPNNRSPSLRTWGSVALSTEALGTTNSDVIDTGGLSLGSIALSSPHSVIDDRLVRRHALPLEARVDFVRWQPAFLCPAKMGRFADLLLDPRRFVTGSTHKGSGNVTR